MLRLICSLLLFLIACAVFSAPTPEDSWELPIDPGNDYKLDIKDGTVTIELPGGDHDFDPKRKRFNAPRLLRDVEGDFVVQVRVSASFRPSAKSSAEREVARVAAGLLIILTNKDYMRLEHEAYRRTDEQRQPNKTEKKGGQRREPELFIRYTFKMLGERWGSVYEQPWEQDRQAKQQQIYLRFERQGNGFQEATSTDGKMWTTHTKMTGLANLPRKFKVGLAAYSTSTEPFKVRFDQFKLSKGEEKSK